MVRPTRGPISRNLDRLLIALFVLALSAPAADHWLRPDSARSPLRENRRVSARPGRPDSLEALSVFPRRLESYFDDRLGCRDLLLRAQQALLLFVFGCGPAPTTIAGSNGTFYLGADQAMPIWRGLAPYDVARLEKWTRALEARRDWLKARGIAYLFVIAPNKEALYPEHLPANQTKLGPTLHDQLYAWLAQHSDVRVLDLRPALRAEKAHDEGGDYVYHPLGTHWTWRGGWAACNAILECLVNERVRAPPIAREHCRRERQPESESDSMGETTYIGDLLHQEAWAFTQTDARDLRFAWGAVDGCASARCEVDDPSLPRVLLVHDSFGPWLLSYLAQRCAQLTTFRGYLLPRALIQEMRPDFVVEMVVERVLGGDLPPIQIELEEIGRARFEEGERVWGPLDLGSKEVAARRFGAIDAEAQGADLRLDAHGPSGGLLLPAALIPVDKELALHIDLSVAAPGTLNLCYQLADAPGFSRMRVADIRLRAGRNDDYLRVRVQNLSGEILLRVGDPPGPFTLHALEARVVR